MPELIQHLITFALIGLSFMLLGFFLLLLAGCLMDFYRWFERRGE